MAHCEFLPVLLPLVRLGTGVAGAEPRHPGDLCRGQPIAALKYGLRTSAVMRASTSYVLRRSALCSICLTALGTPSRHGANTSFVCGVIASKPRRQSKIRRQTSRFAFWTEETFVQLHIGARK
jgi:hypothetical protein